MASIRDVAACAGVSIATVSRVIHQDPHNKISSKTREQVLEAMRKLHYEPRSAGRKPRAAGQERFRAGCILNSMLPKFSDRFYTAILTSFEAEFNRLGGDLSFIKTVREIENCGGRLGALLEDIDYVLTMEYIGDDLLREIRANVKSVVGVDISDWRIAHVGYNRIHAAALAAEYLIARGHRRIAYIGGEECALAQNVLHARIDDERFVGFCHQMSYRGLPVDDALVGNCKWDRRRCEALTREMLALQNPPTAILAASDNMAIAAISACGKMGLAVPDDISVMGISDIEEAQFSNPPLTTVRVPTAEIGVEAARLFVREALTAQEMDPSTGPRLICLPTCLVERGSVRRLEI